MREIGLAAVLVFYGAFASHEQAVLEGGLGEGWIPLERRGSRLGARLVGQGKELLGLAAHVLAGLAAVLLLVILCVRRRGEKQESAERKR